MHADDLGTAEDSSPKDGESDPEDMEFDVVAETDQERRRAMLESADQVELEGMKNWQLDYSSEFVFPTTPSGTNAPSEEFPQRTSLGRESISKGKEVSSETIEISSDDDEDTRTHLCDVQRLPRGGTATAPVASSERVNYSNASGIGGLDYQYQRPPPGNTDESRAGPSGSGAPHRGGRTPPSLRRQATGGSQRKAAAETKTPFRSLARDEMDARKRESLGLSGGRRLGGTLAASRSGSNSAQRPRPDAASTSSAEGNTSSTGIPASPEASSPDGSWACGACTL